MRKSGVFWGLVLSVIGLIALLKTTGVIDINVWALIWPSAIILVGLWLILRPAVRKADLVTAQEKILLEGAQEAQISIAHGAGTIDLHALDEPGVLLEGSFGGGVRKDVQRVGNTLKVKLDAEFDWVFPTVDHGWFWSLGLTRDIPLDIRVKGGANEATLNLEHLRVQNLVIETGASSTQVYMPRSAGMTHARVDAGVASVKIYIPDQAAARICVESGLTGVNIIAGRFNRVGDEYISPDYETAQNKIDLLVKAGVGSIDIQSY